MPSSRHTTESADEGDQESSPPVGRVVHVDRHAALVDGITYYRALRASLLRARHQIWIVGWDLHSEIDLLRGEAAEAARAEDGAPVRLADVLEHAVEHRPDLHVRLLIWKGSALFAAERQHLPRMKRPWATHPRIRLEWDEDVPPLASRHRKNVIIDDRVAYSGGSDLAPSRWDSRSHRADDERRRLPGLLPSFGDPYHELMAAVDDEAARVIGDMARDRWRTVTGEAIDPPPLPGAGEESAEAAEAAEAARDPWPPDVEPLVRDHEITIVVTEPASVPDDDQADAGSSDSDAESGGVREVETTLVRQISEAERLIFIETQYLTADSVVEALEERLRDPDGPEVVLLLPWGCPGRLQAMALDPHRDRMLDRLRDAATDGRLGIYWATRDGPEPDDPHAASVYIHAKTLLVDDTLLRIGSANLNRRSMGLDSECDVFLVAHDDDQRHRIATLRRSILADMLQVPTDRVAEAESEAAADGPRVVIPAIEALRGGRATLVPFEHRAPEECTPLLPLEVTDPDRPLSLEDVERVAGLMRADRRIRRWFLRRWNGLVGIVRHHRGRLTATLIAAAAVVALALSPLSELSADDLLHRLESIASGPAGMLGAAGTFTVLASLGVPVLALIVATGVALGAATAIPVSLAGTLGAAAIGRAIGGGLRGLGDGGRDDDGANDRADDASGGWRQRITSAARRISQAVHRHGTVAVAITRNLPVAPFPVVNLAFGVAGVPWRPYMLGTAVGMLPGIVVLSVLGRGVAGVIDDPSPRQILLLAGAVLLLVIMIVLTHRLRHRWLPDEDVADDGSVATDGTS